MNMPMHMAMKPSQVAGEGDAAAAAVPVVVASPAWVVDERGELGPRHLESAHTYFLVLDRLRHEHLVLHHAIEPAFFCNFLERQHLGQRLDAHALRGVLVQRVGAGEHREQVDYVLLSLLVDIEMLMLARSVKRVTKEFA